MVLTWKNYQTDLGYNYPFVPISVRRISQINRDTSPLLVLPANDQLQIQQVDYPCSVPQLTPRKIKLYFSDDSIYELSYYRTFTQDLFDDLSASISVRAFEFIGENIRYSRLIKMLNRG